MILAETENLPNRQEDRWQLVAACNCSARACAQRAHFPLSLCVDTRSAAERYVCYTAGALLT